MHLRFRLPATAALSVLASIISLHAATLVYEGFNGYTVGVALGMGVNANPNANTIGLDSTSAWSGSGVANYTYTSAGLTFGALQTTGGAVTFPNTNVAVAAAKLSVASYTGTLYSSYLVNFSTLSSGSGNGFLTRVGDNNSTSGERFQTFSDTRVSTNTTLATRYNANSASTESTATLSLNTTYIIISRFTNVGTAPTTGTPGTSTLYALDLAQFGNLIAAADQQAYLDATDTGTAANQITGRITNTSGTGAYQFDNTDFAQFLSVNDGGTFDEYRYGSTLEGVVPVPEPASSSLLLLSILVFSHRKRTH